jgi:hypothetical protein
MQHTEHTVYLFFQKEKQKNDLMACAITSRVSIHPNRHKNRDQSGRVSLKTYATRHSTTQNYFAKIS